MSSDSQKAVIVGQGYVGLPVAMRAVEAGYDVVGVDLDVHRVQMLEDGRSYVDDITDEELQSAIATGRYVPSSSYDAARGFDIAVVTVPTPLRESAPDLSFIESSARSLAECLTPGATVILESTTYPGTTEELFSPLLAAGSGLQAGQDFHVGYSPERIDPGNTKWGFKETPKVVSGIDQVSLLKVKDFYDRLVDRTVSVSTPKEAELTKLLENTFRHVNIALVNELAIFANQLGVDIWESIEAASSKPFGFMKFTPGAGVGGHCLPVDPSYLSWEVKRKLGQNFRFVELANDVNEHMPDYVVQRLSSLLNEDKLPINGSKILLVGLAYKKNTGDIRESPAIRLIDLLQQSGAILSAVDEHIEDHHWPTSVEKVTLSHDTVSNCDAVVLLTDHDDIDLNLLSVNRPRVFDTKNVLTGANAVHL